MEIRKPGPLQSIFLAEFDPDRGPQIWYQYPKNVISKKAFDSVSVYIISKPQIQRKVITLNALGHKITGYPNEIENRKYARNALKFNLCFVCKSDSRTIQYEPVVKKLSEYLEHLELENGILSNENSKKELAPMIEKIFKELNSKSMCTITMQLKECKPPCSSVSLDSDLLPPRPNRVERRQTMISHQRPQISLSSKGIRNYDKKSEPCCPKGPSIGEGRESHMMSRRASDADTYLKSGRKSMSDLADKRNNDSFNSSDLSSEIDSSFRQRGFNKECSNVSELHLKVVNVQLEPEDVQEYHVPVFVYERGVERGINLQGWDLTTQQIIPYINSTNHVGKIAALAEVENNLVKKCIQNLLYYNVVKLLPIFQYSNVYTVTSKINELYMDESLKSECLSTVSLSKYSVPSFRNVFQLYCSMEYGVSIKDICIKYNPQALNIDERRLVKFGLMHGIIRRVHQYPVYDPHSYSEQSLPIYSKNAYFYKLCNGTHHFDDICCRLSLTYGQLLDKIERDPNISIIC